MHYSMYLHLVVATLAPVAKNASEDTPTPGPALEGALDVVVDLIEQFRHGPVSPTRTAQFEQDLRQAVQDLARVGVEWTYNHLEPADVQALPPEVDYEYTTYRRLKQKTPQQVSTLFGNITVHRLGYRSRRADGEPVLFPLCRALGIVHSATPALIERIAYYQAESGATQQRTRLRLRHEHRVCCGVKRLRQLTTFVAQAMEGERTQAQVERLWQLLAQAQASRGRHRPVLGVGRDGITLGLPVKGGSVYEVATTGTITVYNRRGRRLGTVYLAFTPEAGQATMSAALTRLLQEVLRGWTGPLPRLCYVTDAGDNETSYYRKVLRRMRHPVTGQQLEWLWVVDYYHASLRLWTLAEALFGTSPRLRAWARKMEKLLLKPGGIGRVLHSAAALRSRLKLCGKRLQDFRKAYRYLQTRRRHLKYADYRRLGLPIGSGVTEAACKTVYTQRLKLSGMRWKKAGAQTILRLRVILLSGVWEEVYRRMLMAQSEVKVRTPGQRSKRAARKAA